MSRPKLLAVIAIVVAVLLFENADYFNARLSGDPVTLVSSTGSLETVDMKHPLQPFTNVFIRDGNLHVVTRAWFYNTGPFAQPYLSRGPGNRGVVHIWLKPQVTLFAAKCEFLRQFEIKMPSSQWQQLSSLQLYFHDTGAAGENVFISNPALLAKLLADSKERLALQSLEGTTHGC